MIILSISSRLCARFTARSLHECFVTCISCSILYLFHNLYESTRSFLKLRFTITCLYVRSNCPGIFFYFISNFPRFCKRGAAAYQPPMISGPRNKLRRSLYFTPANSISLLPCTPSGPDSFSCRALLKKTLKNERDDDCDYERANNGATRQTDRGRRRMMMMSKSRRLA